MVTFLDLSSKSNEDYSPFKVSSCCHIKMKKEKKNKVTAKTFLFIRKVFCAVIFALNKTRSSKKID